MRHNHHAATPTQSQAHLLIQPLQKKHTDCDWYRGKASAAKNNHNMDCDCVYVQVDNLPGPREVVPFLSFGAGPLKIVLRNNKVQQSGVPSNTSDAIICGTRVGSSKMALLVWDQVDCVVCVRPWRSARNETIAGFVCSEKPIFGETTNLTCNDLSIDLLQYSVSIWKGSGDPRDTSAGHPVYEHVRRKYKEITPSIIYVILFRYSVDHKTQKRDWGMVEKIIPSTY